jgi:hypothetical protein
MKHRNELVPLAIMGSLSAAIMVVFVVTVMYWPTAGLPWKFTTYPPAVWGVSQAACRLNGVPGRDDGRLWSNWEPRPGSPFLCKTPCHRVVGDAGALSPCRSARTTRDCAGLALKVCEQRRW